MNKSILEALMRLFAIIADVGREGLSGTARAVVESYLKRQLSLDLVNKYLTLFDKFLDLYHNPYHDNVYDWQRESAANSVRILQICKQINEELEQTQKILVLIELFEFARENYELSERELEFIETVAVTFKINREEFDNIKAFISSALHGIPENDKFLIIDSNPHYSNLKIKHILNENLLGKIYVLHIPSINAFVFRYVGYSTIFLNGNNIKSNRSYVLEVGSVIKSPKINTIYYGTVVSKFIEGLMKTKVVYIAHNVEHTFKDGTIGLHSFSFSEESGKLVGIMGGSGVGKSTLLNVLNGTLPLNKGQITINGFDLHQENEAIKGVIGYVPQDDLLIEELTVFENLYYNAKLCFRDYTEAQIVDTIEKAIIDFDLYEARNLKVGDPMNKFISGGQRKRLNIALELIREPSILFVDEPTSGLSSVDAEKVINLLKRQTIKGKLVIANIHQPSSDIYKQMDRLLIMDKGGRIVYNGNPIDANVYFKTMSNYVNADERECATCGNVNTDESLRIIEARMVNEYGRLTRIRKVQSEEWYELYKKNIEPQKNRVLEERLQTAHKEQIPENHFKIPNHFHQFKIFVTRNLLSKFSNLQYLFITFVEAPLLAVILSYFTKYSAGTPDNSMEYIFAENRNFPAYLFMSVIVSLFLGLTISAGEIIKDRKILKRESFLNLSRASYLFSKTMVLFLISAVQLFLYVLVGNSILEIKGMLFQYWLVLFSTSCLANLMGLNISAGMNSIVNIYILVPFVLVPQILLSGVIINFNDLRRNVNTHTFVPFEGDLMASRWAYEALAVEQFKGNAYQKNFFAYNQKISNSTYLFAYLIPTLETKLDETERYTSKNVMKDKVQHNLTLISNELLKWEEEHNSMKFKYLAYLNPQKFSSKVAVVTREYLNEIRSYCTKEKEKASHAKDAKYEQLLHQLGRDQLQQLKLKNENRYLEMQLLNKTELKAMVETENHLLRLKDPIFMLPESQFIRSHFYAPVKYFLGSALDTFWFNVGILWLTSLLLFASLYLDCLRKGIEYIEQYSKRIFRIVSEKIPRLRKHK